MDEGVAMRVLWKYRRSGHPETPNDATSGNVTVTRDKDEFAAAPSCAQSDGLGVDATSLTVSIGNAYHCGLAVGRPDDTSERQPLASISQSDP